MTLQVFKKEEFGEIRTVILDGEPWFVGKDVADALGYGNYRQALATNIDAEDKGVQQMDTPGGKQEMTIINESGLYSLIMSSKLQGAKEFKRWVTGDVLPSIRKNGMYATDELLSNPDFAIEVFTRLKEERQARIEAERKNAVLMHVKKTYTATEIAKELGFRSAIELNEKLEQRKVQFKMNDTWVPTADYSECGYFHIKQEVLDNGKVIYHRRITQIGRDFILDLFTKEGAA